MNNIKLSSNSTLKIISCFIFDLAMLVGFLKILGLFFIIAPEKSILCLFVLIVSLFVFNAAILFPKVIFEITGTPYSVSLIGLLIFYAFVANIFSISLIAGSVIRYIAWELILFATFLFIFNVIVSFSKKVNEGALRDKVEYIEKNNIKLIIIEIESAFNEKEYNEELLTCINSFKSLKERIQLSTPFGRITGNNSVTELENKINDNLVNIASLLKSDVNNKSLFELKKIIENTRKLVINREALNIK